MATLEELHYPTLVLTPAGFRARVSALPPTESGRVFVVLPSVGMDGPYLPEELRLVPCEQKTDGDTAYNWCRTHRRAWHECQTEPDAQ